MEYEQAKIEMMMNINWQWTLKALKCTYGRQSKTSEGACHGENIGKSWPSLF
jgi:hypothetical protein